MTFTGSSSTQTLSRGELLRLAGWKVRQRGRHAIDRAGGAAWMEARGRRWVDRNLPSGPQPLSAWLARADAGRFWLTPEGAAEWAAESFTPHDGAVADAAVEGVFDLLGSGPVRLGEPVDWRRDLYSGAEWPLVTSSRLRIVRGDGSDIRTVWELSRGYHLLPLARAYWHSGEARYRDAFVAHLSSFVVQNPVDRGPHWASPMDVALRSANWTLAAILFAPDPGIARAFWSEVLAQLYTSGLFLERHLEWHPVYRGNHYVSNGVGLVYLGTLFRGTRSGDRWLRVGTRIVTDELLRQVHSDGVSFESSLAYHRLVTEFFAYARSLIRLNAPGRWRAEHEERILGMYRFIAAYLPPGGEAPMLGDADDGRLHAVSARSLTEPRRHALGLPADHWPEDAAESEAFPEGGFYVLRHGDDHAILRCGAVGLKGAGSHDHNDQLSLELVIGGRRVIADSGTYAYTRNLAARYAFRSTAAHSVVQLGGEEQNPIRPDRPWRVLRDRTRSTCTEWEIAKDRLRFAGRHHGYTYRASRAIVSRALAAEVGEGSWQMVDRVEGEGTETLSWRLHLAETLDGSGFHPEDGYCEAVLPGEPEIRIRVTLPAGLRASLVSTPISDRYGEQRERSCILLEGEVDLPLEILTTISAVP